MHVEVPLSLVWSFVAVWVRIAGIFTFLPIPGLRSPIDPPRLFFSLAVTVCMFPQWPTIEISTTPISSLLILLLGEVVLGLSAGVVLSLVFEAFQFAAQVIAQQAGFSYASTIDPSNDTDTGVLLILCQLLTGWISIAIGLDRQLLTLLAGSLATMPPGHVHASMESFQSIARLGSQMFELGLQLALPAVALSLLLDILLGVLSRLEQHLGLTTILFPAKTAGALIIAALTIGSVERAVESQWIQRLPVLRAILGG
jgi:flagellar biosynthetic protein FliR